VLLNSLTFASSYCFTIISHVYETSWEASLVPPVTAERSEHVKTDSIRTDHALCPWFLTCLDKHINSCILKFPRLESQTLPRISDYEIRKFSHFIQNMLSWNLFAVFPQEQAHHLIALDRHQT
jgi:hypothetical protein